MKLWLLRPLDENKLPWSSWHNKSFGFVIRAETEAEAREFASQNSGAEGEDSWRDEGTSSCQELLPSGEPGVIIEDIHPM